MSLYHTGYYPCSDFRVALLSELHVSTGSTVHLGQLKGDEPMQYSRQFFVVCVCGFRNRLRFEGQKGDYMNPEKVLEQIAEQMTKAAAEHTGSILVCIRDGGVFACRNDRRGKPALVLTRYKAEVVREGLTPDEWRLLSRKIARATGG
jgi:hypothetical protein